MKWIPGRRPHIVHSALSSASSEVDDRMLSRRMRTAAVEMHAEGRMQLRLSRAELYAIREKIAEAQAMHLRCVDGGAALERLIEDSGLMEACAEQARRDAAARLPAVDGETRIVKVMECLGGDEMRLNRDRVLLGVASFDDVQPLEMAELWAVPQAMRVCLCRAWLRTAQQVLQISGERQLAERWVSGARINPFRREPAFFEHALQLLTEREDGERRAQLERRMEELGVSLSQLVQTAHGQESLLRMQMENITANKRLIDELDWQKCFEMLSAVEQELTYDPAGVYPRMDSESKAALREQVRVLAQRLKLNELTVARHAVRSAQLAEGDVRNTVCYWLYDDEGRHSLAARMGAADAVLPKIVSDPSGRKSVAGITALFAVLFGLYLTAVHSIWFVGMGIPLAWGAAMALLGRVFPMFIKPARLLKLEIESVPDELRTLVVMPVLLSSVERAEEICSQFESLGCLEMDDNIRYLILGDFADADSEHRPDDAEIVDAVRERIAAMNVRAGREQYFYLHRERRLLEADRRWMGRDRKRGALMDLNRLLLDEAGAEEAFQIEGACVEKLKRRFRYVLTLDADTRFLPGTVQKLIGTLAHPLNQSRMEDGRRKGYAVLQPRMEMTASACVNGYVRLFAGNGGLDSYPSSVSGFWQDVTGVGLFGGKGLYDVAAFNEALTGALPEGKILSHDLIEGTLAGAAQVSDVCFYDGFPSALGGFLKRQNRWMRGDWQLLPVLLSRRKYPVRERGLSAAERLRLLDNLMRSLWAPSLIGLLTQAVWMGHAGALAVGMILAYGSPLLNLFSGDRTIWRRATAELALLPASAACSVDAIARTLWRLLFTKRHLLDWVTSADAEKGAANPKLANRIAAILLIPGFFVAGGSLAALALGLLFLIGPGWVRDMEQDVPERSILPEDEALLRELAADTWRFFESCVSIETNFLPPDNVQMDPNVGAANRTSPTNMGLYLMCCVSAWNLGLVSEREALRRMADTVDSMEKMERWKGHYYNWYAIDALRPLNPRYVSSVDSGNLAASLLLCASAVEHADRELSERMCRLAKEMNFTALYDSDRNLFRIGADVERNHLSEAHYDLLASEARILSYTAMMLGQVPLRHWSRLGRHAVNAGKGGALLSWSGTMFEYLMPELFLSAPQNTLLGQTVRNVILAQQMQGARSNRPWGVSESGYYAFDLYLNYQYRAFGLRELSLSGQACAEVVAPYASVMTAAVDPHAAAENIRRMENMGWRSAMGMYEAADYLHAPENGSARIVKSHMAHHQGMALCALCNCLTDGSLIRAFHRIPEARALDLLLEERPLRRMSGGLAKSRIRRVGNAAELHREERIARPDRRLVDVHLLGAANAMAVVTANGAVHYMRNGVQATRFDGDFLNHSGGACVHVRRERTGEAKIIGEQAIYAPGCARWLCSLGAVQCEMEIAISPEDGTLFKRVLLKNDSESEETVTVTDCMPVALDRQGDQRAHPVFRHLFVESERRAKGALVFKRRGREPKESWDVLTHLISAPGSIACETDFEKLTGRSGSVLHAGSIRNKLTNITGAVLNPCSALESTLSVAPKETVELHFAVCILPEDGVETWIDRNSPESMAERAIQLSSMQSKAMQGFIGLDARRAALLNRLTALLLDARLRTGIQMRKGEPQSCGREALWSMGISGDLPMIAVHASDAQRIRAVRDAIRAHEFYRGLGLQIDLVLVDEQGGGYAQPVREVFDEAVSFSHLNELRGKNGGVHLVDGARMNREQRIELHRASAVSVEASQDFYAQIRTVLAVLDVPRRTVQRMKPGVNKMPRMKADGMNGFGGFLPDGRYAIDVLRDHPTPAPWSNLMANDDFGILLTERGGGFLWYENSRSGRLTAFANDALCEGWGWMLYLVNEQTQEFIPLLPGAEPAMAFRVIYAANETIYRFETEKLSGELALCVRADAPELRMHLTLRSSTDGKFRIAGFVDWLMGTHEQDAAQLCTWTRDGACFAAGAMDGVGYFAAANARVYTGCDRNTFLGRGGIHHPEGILENAQRSGGWVLNVPVELRKDIPNRSDWVIGAAKDSQQAGARVRGFYAQPDYEPVRSFAMDDWKRRVEKLKIETPDTAINRMANGWLLHQTLTARVRARTGMYQPGGAYGFRDQLQDMLAILPNEPRRVRAHLLRCAAHQFEDGDVMHWWHEPFLGVRTHISDDMLFLPYVTAQYVKWTQDTAILHERQAYLENVEIEEGKADVFQEMHPSAAVESLHGHCMRAFRRAAEATGIHGLALMGGGDWNDGMNRVGENGKGESVWLSMFISVCAEEYATVSPDDTDRCWLMQISQNMKAAVENSGWDGEWYLRAYMDDGSPLGSASNEECRIDAISQAWSVLAGLDKERCRMAMDSAWRMLVDERLGIIRLLTPPFSGEGMDPGYISRYPQGVRENGAQYTHAACWMLLALIRMGDSDRAHRAIRMLMPANHSDTEERAKLYRVEPYVVAADVYDGIHAGRGGWTWYTGSAAWMYRCILALLGFEREGNRVRVCALLGDWSEAAVTVQHGGSTYRLVSRKESEGIELDGKRVEGEWIEMTDDGRKHIVVFPPRSIPAVD